MTTLKAARELYELKKELYKQKRQNIISCIERRGKEIDSANEVLLKKMETNNEIINIQLEHNKEMAYTRYMQSVNTSDMKENRRHYQHCVRELAKRIKIQQRLFIQYKQNLEANKNFILNTLWMNEYDNMDHLDRESRLAEVEWTRLKRERELNRLYKSISKKKMEENSDDVCGICLEAHNNKDTYITGCKHQYGKDCFKQWVVTCQNQRRQITCPMCKCVKPKIFQFKEKEPREKKHTTPVSSESEIIV